MGTGLFDFIAQACRSLAATAAPSITAMGIHIVIALATIMLVWFGVQEALASAHGGPGFSMGRFLNLFMLLTFAYVMVNYYDSSIPGLGFSIKGFIDGGTINLVNLIGADGSATMLNEIHTASSKTGPSLLNSLMSPYYAIVYFVVQFLLALLAAIISAILAYGAIAATIIGLLGPIFIPFLVFDKLDWLFWGWLKAYLGFSFYKVVAAATHECSVSCSDQLLHPTWPEHVRPFNDGSDAAASDPSRTGQHLHSLQDSDHDAQLIHWRYWWTRRGLGHGDDGDTGRDVNGKKNEVTDEHRNNEYGNQSDPGNHPSRRALPGAIRRPVGDEYLLESDHSCACRHLHRAGGAHLQEPDGARQHAPMIVRINDVGHAEAIDYRNFQYRPQEAENKYYLTRWADLYFSRNRFTIERDQTQSLYFLNSDVQRAVIDQERKDNSIQNYVKDSSLPYIDVEIKNVILDDLRQSPYSARIEFEKVYSNPADHSELKRERWTASVTYVFRENVKNNELAVNPLGLTIVRFRADQAFS
jgi:type IV secretory pathway TrbF-like protein